ncbi:MAG: cytochrome c3 family protein [Thermodesulfobacteriota bacterium]
MDTQRRLRLGVAAALLLLAGAVPAQARVVGVCSNCHTMHNSQNGSALVASGTGAGWSGGAVTGGTGSGVQESLLVTDCVGCHTSGASDTIVTVAGSRIPIVYNTVPPASPLAGGNFYWVASTGDAYGHNVRGISDQDAALAAAPGAVACANSCHTSLTLSDAQTSGGRKNGCQGCHNSVRHHGEDPAGQPVGAAGGWYRFLAAPSGHDLLGGAGVNGIEDPDWEQHATSAVHNTYYGGDGTDTESPQSIGKFCAGCHYNFHSPGSPTTLMDVDNGGGANPWLRHPADAVIPNDPGSEYTAYTVYDPQVPVGRPEASLTGFVGSAVRPGTDKVICLSCHRAHGSPNPDLLRWPYGEMVLDTSGAAAGTGCFTCHSAKDGV